jgi:hypothetical protein
MHELAFFRSGYAITLRQIAASAMIFIYAELMRALLFFIDGDIYAAAFRR